MKTSRYSDSQIITILKQVIRLYRKKMPVMQIVAHTGLSWSAVNHAIPLFEAKGAAGLMPAVRGKKARSLRRLSEDQERTIQQIICDKRPEQLKMEFALWNRAAVLQLIECEFGITLSVRGVGTYLARWEFTPRKPIKKAYEQQPEAMRHLPCH